MELKELALQQPTQPAAQPAHGAAGVVQQMPTSAPVGNAANPREDRSRSEEMRLANTIALKTGDERGTYNTLIKACVIYGCQDQLERLMDRLGGMTPSRYKQIQKRFGLAIPNIAS